MALRRILKYPDSLLKKPAEEVENIDGSVAALLGDMTETMYAAPGVGLAGPQVGARLRVVVLDVDQDDQGTNRLELINPAIAEREGTIVWEEGCLSVVDYTAEVRRSAKVLVKAWTVDQKEVEVEAEELLAVVLQHEIDHLDGKLFIDRISSLKRSIYRRKIQKMIREGTPLAEKKPHVGF